MIRSDYMNSSVTYKFILYKMKMLVTDNRGRLRYLESLDNILYDVFGIKNTMKKINNAYDPREISGLIDNLGVSVLLQLFNSGKMYKILEDLVQINYRMNELKKEIRKQSRKDKRDKDDVKEYNYLMDLYKKSIKYIRNKFGIKNAKTSYKRKYQSLNNIVKNKGYGDYWDEDDESFTSILMRDDEYYFDDDDDDDFDPSTSELEDFVNMMHGGRKKKNVRRYDSYDDYDDDDDDNMSLFDDEDDYDYRRKSSRSSKYDQIPPSIDEGLHEQMSVLTDTVAELSSAVQHLMMKDEYNAVQRKRDTALREDLNRKLVDIDEFERQQKYATQQYPQHYNQPPMNKEVEILTDLVRKLQKDQTTYREYQKRIAESLDYALVGMDNLAKKQDALAHLIFDDDEDDEYFEDEDIESGFGRPIVRNAEEPMTSTRLGDPYYEDDETESPMTREEMIDIINSVSSAEKEQGPIVTAKVEASKTTVKMESTSANNSPTSDNNVVEAQDELP